MKSPRQLASFPFRIFFIVAIFATALFSVLPQPTYARPNLDGGGDGGDGGGCSGTTWEYNYTLVTNPFPPGSAGEAAFRAVYGGDSYTVQSTYQVARIGDIDEGCIEEPTTPYVGIIATPSSVSSGGSSLLTWTSDYVTSCTGTNFSTGGATAGSLIVSPTSSKTYSITCTNGAQTVSSSAIVTVSAPVVAPTASLSANPTSLVVGASSTLTWSSTNATSCTGTSFSTASATAGSVTVTPSQTTSYLVSCTGAGGSASASQTVTVTALASPTVSLSATPTSLSSGSSSTLSWSSANAISCAGDGFESGGNTSGSISTGALSASTNYSITCTGASAASSGTWQLYYNDISDFYCNPGVTRVSSLDRAYSGLAWCPSSPAGKACSGVGAGNVCKINVANDACQIETAVYQCVGASPATTPQSAFDTTNVTVSSNVGTLSGSCSVSPTSGYIGDPFVWTATATGGSGGSGGLVWRPGTASYTKICTGGTNYTSLDTNTCSEDTSDGDACSVEGSKCKVSAGCDGNTYTDGEGQTNAHTTYGSVIPYTCTATGSSSNSSSYTYSWSGTESLSGTVASIAKTYTAIGTKTASVVITSPSGVSSITLQAEKHCSGGTKVGGYGTTEDGVGFTGGADSTFAAVCAEITPAGGCCSVDVRETLTSTGQPVNTYYRYEAYSNASLASKASTNGNTTRHNYFAGMATASAPVSVTASCSNSVVVGVSLADLTTGSLTPLSVTAGVNTTFTAGVSNTGGAATPVFGSRMYVCLASDSACLNNYLTQSNSIWSRIFSFFTRFAEANTSIKIALSRISIAAGGSGTQTGSYTFPSPGSYQMRFCADTPLNEVSESNELDNCSAWTSLTVNPGAVTASCSPSPSTGYVGDSLTWSVTPSGGVGSYTYVWSGTDGLTGTGATVSKTYGSAGTKSASVIVTSGAGSVTATCATGTIQNTPTVIITVSPPIIVKGATSPRIDWTSSYTTSCTGTNFPTGNATVGSVTVSPAVTTTYSVTCTNGTRSASASATVTVNPADITLTISPSVTVRQGDPATVSWGVVGTPNTCSISGPGLSSTAFSGAQSVIINQQSTYTMNCLTGGVPSSKSVTIGVTPRFDEF